MKYRLQNGLIFIEDSAGGAPPEPKTGEKVIFTDSCVSVVCMHEIDGEVELSLREASQVAPSHDLAFDGTIDTPSREVMLTTVMSEVLLKAKVPGTRTRIRVWRNHPDWPDQVTIGWG